MWALQIYVFRDKDYNHWLSYHGKDMYQQLEGCFGPYAQCCPCEAFEKKNGPKNQNFKN